MLVSSFSPLHRNLALQANSLDRALKRLSTGLRITSAADDAAGSSISTKLRAQVLGYNQASRNIQDATSMLQTADAGLEGIQGYLQRMRVLALVAGNDTLTREDRERIQAEIDQIRRGIQDISEGTRFNTHKLLRGEMTGLSDAFTDTDEYHRGVSAVRTVPTSSLTQNQSVNLSPQSVEHANQEPFTTRDLNPGWSASNDRIEIVRGGTRYEIPSGGGIASASTGDPFTRHQSRVIGGNSYQLRNYWVDGDGYYHYDGIYVTRDGGALTQLVSFLDSSGVQMAFSNDGARIAFTASTESDISNVDVYVGNFDAASMTLTGRYRLNQDGDMLGVPQTYTLSRPAEWYQRTDLERSFRVFVERDTPAGPDLEVPYDATGTDGYTMSPDRRSFTFHGAYQVDSNDVIRTYFQSDYNMAQDPDGNVSLVAPYDPEIYHLGTPEASVRILVNGVAVPHDPLHLNGFDYDASTKRFTLYGDARPRAMDDVELLYQADRLGAASYQNSDGDGVVMVPLPERAEVYNLDNSASNKSIRVYVGGVEVPYLDASGNGYSYDDLNRRIYLHGTGRPSATDDIEIRYVTDQNVLTPDGRVQFRLPTAADTYYQTDAGPVRSIRVLVDNVEVALDETNGYTYNEATRTVTFHGSARPDAGQDIEVRWIPQNDADNLYSLGLGHAPELYDPEEGSILVTRDGAGVLTRVQVADGTGNGYFVDGTIIRLVGSARPEAMDSSTTYQAHYVLRGDNTVTLAPDVAPPPTIDPDCLPHYIPPRATGLVIDEGTIVVRVNNTVIGNDEINGWSLTKVPGAVVDGVQTYDRYDVTLNGDARLMGQVGGNEVTVTYNFRYASRDDKAYDFLVGANTDAWSRVEIPPVGIDELNLNDVCVLKVDETQEAIRKADAALARVSEIRSGLGAAINGLQHQAMNATQMSLQNDQARSRIMDADMAMEALNMVRSQVLSQSAQAMLQQGRLHAQRVTELLMNGTGR